MDIFCNSLDPVGGEKSFCPDIGDGSVVFIDDDTNLS